LPRRVYWFRRLLVLGIACALVVGIARLLDWSAEDPESEQASAVAGSPSATVSEDTTSPQPRKRQKQRPDKTGKGKGDDDKVDKAPRPDGPCEESDVLVTPTVPDAHAGSRVKIVLEVTTVESPACFFEVSPDSVFVNVDGEDGTLWSSQHCPDAVPTETVVARRERAATVPMWWDGRLSDEGCPTWSPWLEVQGGYTAIAAVRGSVTPVAIGFFLGTPVAATVTRAATPTPTPTDEPSERDRPKRDRQDRDRDR
jgi:hypothetical protein